MNRLTWNDIHWIGVLFFQDDVVSWLSRRLFSHNVSGDHGAGFKKRGRRSARYSYSICIATNSHMLRFSTTGAVQGIVTGIRGLCNGLGPAAFGLLFGLFHVDLTEPHDAAEARNQTVSSVRVNSVIVCISGNYNKLSLCAFPRKCLGLLFCLGPY